MDLSSPTVKLLTFEEFCQSSVKNKVLPLFSDCSSFLIECCTAFYDDDVLLQALSVREMFGKQLVQFDGVSAEVAIEILDKFPTLDRHVYITHRTTSLIDNNRMIIDCSLLRAYDRLASEEEKSKMLVDIRHGRTDK